MEFMIDALELLVPATATLNENFRSRSYLTRAEVKSWYDHVYSDTKEKPILRVYGGHGNKKLAPPKNFRVEFKDVHLLTKWDFPGQILEAFRLGSDEIDNLKVHRIDFAVDVWRVPVSWFREHAAVKYKQCDGAFPGWTEDNKRGMTTLTFGTHCDFYRIYNKTAEILDRKEQFLWKGMENGDSPPAITRVERQCVGRGVPKKVSTLGTLLDKAAEFDPFQRLVIDAQECEPDIDRLDAQTWLKAEGLRAVVEKYGRQRARKMLNQKSGGKASRIFQRYSMLFDTSAGVTTSQLTAVYRKSTMRQFNPLIGTPAEHTGMVFTL
jgi:hypothetical protein